MKRQLISFALRGYSESYLKDLLSHHFDGKAADAVLEEVWRDYTHNADAISANESSGGQLILSVAALVYALHSTLLRHGGEVFSEQLLGELKQVVLARVVQGAEKTFFARAQSKEQSVSEALRFVLAFPLTSPSFEIEKQTSGGSVALRVKRCPVAKYFEERSALALCRRTFCSFDSEMTQKLGGESSGVKTLLDGGSSCDFCWHFSDQAK